MTFLNEILFSMHLKATTSIQDRLLGLVNVLLLSHALFQLIKNPPIFFSLLLELDKVIILHLIFYSLYRCPLSTTMHRKLGVKVIRIKIEIQSDPN